MTVSKAAVFNTSEKEEIKKHLIEGNYHIEICYKHAFLCEYIPYDTSEVIKTIIEEADNIGQVLEAVKNFMEELE